ncbi:MAG: DNA/RNA nuclease SfsA [Oscillospiraceae bacterium]|nr:DNA/RNA nuclease SfsA [Oscillospiraceae bacterium]
MTYESISSGIFISRPNRFLAQIEISGVVEPCHVKNTGKLAELLIPGAKVYVNRADNPNRATKYDLVSVFKGERLYNIDSQAPNKAFKEYLESGRYIDGITHIKAEAKHGSSRFDFYVETTDRKIYIETKGVTLEEDGVALFPDAPTLRGVKHLNELAQCIDAGFDAHVVFVIQMDGIHTFAPNNKTHPEFSNALSAAQKAGVKIIALDCTVTKNSMEIRNEIKVKI